MADKFYCAICDVELERKELAGSNCPYCLTEIPEAVEDKPEATEDKPAILGPGKPFCPGFD